MFIIFAFIKFVLSLKFKPGNIATEQQNKMRMKKMLILALLALFYIAASVTIPPQTVVVDDDVGVCYIVNADESVQSINVMQTPSAQVICYVSPATLSSDVEESEIYTWQNNKNSLCEPIASKHDYQRQHRLDIGENFSGASDIARYT